ncbi:MAG: N-acetylmuramoyl-L-alanine amidase family protein [Anaerolineae bacterium]
MKHFLTFALFFLQLFVFLVNSEAVPVKKSVKKKGFTTFSHKSYKKAHPADLTLREKFLVVLDAGHGGTADGAKVQSLKEKRIALTTTLLAKKHLEAMGYPVVLTRSQDADLSLSQRAALANQHNASLFVSIHYNACKNSEAKGVEVFYYLPLIEDWRTRASRRLGTTILKTLLEETQALSRGVKHANHHVTRETRMPAVLVEGGFMTNKEECTLLKDRIYLNKIAKGIALGIDHYLRS